MAVCQGKLIGADEAGYGPNLGPLVVSATCWDLPAASERWDLFQVLRESIAREVTADGRIPIADSKQLYQPARGLAVLERSVLALLAVTGRRPQSWSELQRALAPENQRGAEDRLPPWYDGVDIDLPIEAHREDVASAAVRLQQDLQRGGVKLAGIVSDIVTEPRFNRLTEDAGSKGAVLTDVTLQLIGRLWRRDAGPPALVICDKHGGRNCYGGALSHLADGAFVAVQLESRARSSYAVGNAEFRFEAQGERHLPVAAASMVSKYVREVAMRALNVFWQKRLPDLRPTKGYPQDAVRFRRDIASVQQELGLADDLVWRRR